MSRKLTQKDLDYISDIFNWNYNTLKVVNNYINEVKDEEIGKVLEEVFDLHYENLNRCISILSGEDYDECEECECRECDCNFDEEEFR